MDEGNTIAVLRAAVRASGAASPDARLETAKNTYRLAEALRANAQYDESIVAAEAALQALEEFPDEHRLVASAHYCLGLAHWQESDTDAYLFHFERSLDRIRNIDDPENLLTLLMQVGLARHNNERLTPADDAYQEALAVIAKIRADHTDRADAQDVLDWVAQQEHDVTRRLGSLKQDQGAFDLARAFFEASRPAADARYDDRLSWLNSVAILAERMDDEQTANATYCQAVRLTSRISRNPRVLSALINAATWFYTNGNKRIGDAIRTRCLRLAHTRSNDADLFELAVLDATIASLDQRFEDAIGHLERAEAAVSNETFLPSVVSERALLLAKIGRWDEARQALRPHSKRPLSHKDRHAVTAAVTLSCLLSDPQGGPDAAEIDEADRVLRAALAAEFRRGGVAAQWRILSALADVAAARGQDNAAVLLGKAAATVIRLGGPTTESGLGPRNLGRLAPLQRLAGRLVDATRYPQASEVKRIYQQEAAYDLLRRDSSLDPRTAEVSLTHEERSLIDELDRIRTSLIAFQHNADAASANDIALKEAELAGWLDRVVKEEWASSCAAPPPKRAHCVPERCVYVDFLSGSAGWTVYARTARAEAEHVIACPPRQLARAIFAFREAVAETRDDWRAHAQALYDLILRPIAQSLAGNTRISFSLSGPFASLPFAALHDGKMHLIERFALSVRTGIRVQERAEPHEEGCTVLLFGPRPTERDDGAQLDTELGSIAALYDDARWATSFTAAGLVEGFRLRPRIAHIASHFRFEAGRPGHSWFALENGERLTMSRFREPAFDLGSLELLVLAMCDSALPDSGDAVLDSMAAVAQCRGAHCVLGTLWPVADRSAALLMTDFHTRLRDARDLTVLSVADALHGAQAAMAAPDCGDLVRSFWAHPYHWAGFVLFEPDP